MRKISTIGMLASLVCSSACTTNPTPLSPSACPTCATCTQAQWQAIEQAVANLPDDSPIISVMEDYLNLRDKLEASQGF